ncbi:MAG TPA: hypothetical protein DHP27_06185 [Parabacteroides distasonis]|jgi:hypothetical protein|nr:hypothetical protein [Parabacteroides distasonis]HCX36174.1 hypothetical protein [Parabacteroides distasonis]
MRLKNILFTIAATTWLFSSCSEETLVDGPVISGGEEATISATLSINSVETKAAANEENLGYETPVSDDEKLINNYVIAVFDATGTNVVGLKAETLSEPATEFTVEVLAKCDGISAQKILTIANLTSAQLDACKAYTTYARFEELVARQTEAFRSGNLMKVALQTQKLNKGKVNSFDIKLDQLVARVDVSFNFSDEGTGASFEITSFDVSKLNNQSTVLLVEKGITPTNTENIQSSISWTKGDNGTSLKSFAFYTYEKVTSNDPVIIKMTGLLKISSDDKGSVKTYQFRLDPVKEDDCNTTGIVHGNSYDVVGTISLSSKTVTFGVTAAGWINKSINAEIGNVNYLFVSERLIYMPNINEYTFSYASNQKVSFSIESVKYTGYDTSGNKVDGRYAESANQYPQIEITPNGTDKGSVKVSMKSVPINYVPTYITLKIKTTDNKLSETVTIIHYPTPYVEAFQNNGGNDYGGVPSSLPGGRHTDLSQNNYNVFSVTSIASGKFMIGDPTATGDIAKYGTFSAVTGVRITGRDAKSNNLVSPKFIIASQRGITNQISQSGAEMRCHLYKEYYDKDGDGVKELMTDWRVPTLAELRYIATLQKDGNSAVKSLLEGSYYWSALTNYEVQMSNANAHENKKEQYVRCVHDIY